jgi:hypothetical protein
MYGRTFVILSTRRAWGDPRVQYIHPQTKLRCSVPLAWTDLASTDFFVEMATGRAMLRLTDLEALSQLLRQLDSDSRDEQAE